MDCDLFDYANTFGTKLGMTKAQRLQTGESSMTHAMGERASEYTRITTGLQRSSSGPRPPGHTLSASFSIDLRSMH